MRTKLFKFALPALSAIIIATILSMWLPYRVSITTDNSFLSISVGENIIEAATSPALNPTGAGAMTNLTPSAGANWQCVSDSSDSTHVNTTSTTSVYDTYAMENHTTQVGTISSVTVYFRASETSRSSGFATPRLRLGTTNRDGTEQNLDSTTDYSQTITRPGGGSWSWSDIDSLEAGIGLRNADGSPDKAYCYKLYIIVTYTPSYALTNTPSSKAFGVVAVSSTYYAKGSAPSNPVQDSECTFTITNSGDQCDLDMKVSDFSGDGGWNIASSNPGANEVQITAYYSGQNPASGLVLANTDAEFKDALAAAATLKWDFKMVTGSSFTDGSQKTGTITITARAEN